ncbi:hypothetical protein AHAS_Ahas11G0273300 [Arachis hypogaea]
MVVIVDESYYLKNLRKRLQLFGWKLSILMYIRMFINMGVFRVYQGASNHEELHNLLKATVMTRRLKKVVLSQLPAKCRQQVRSFISIPSMQSLVHSFAIVCFNQ